MTKSVSGNFKSLQYFFRHVKDLVQETHVLFWLISTASFFVPFITVDVLSRFELVSEPYDLLALFFMFLGWGLAGALLIRRKGISLFVIDIDGVIVVILGSLMLLLNWGLAILILTQIISMAR